MKKQFLFFAIVYICGASSCHNSQSDTVREFIPGTYVRPIKNEFTSGSDSLIITVLDNDGGTFLIVHRSGYQQKVNGNALPPVNKSERWTGVYDKEHHQLEVQQQEKIFTFLPDKGLLMTAGGTEYKKIR